MANIYTFRENDITVSAEKDTLIDLAEKLREVGIEGTWGDLVYQIEYEFDIDGIRTDDPEFYNDLLMEQQEQM
jgi:hypothetical protein